MLLPPGSCVNWRNIAIKLIMPLPGVLSVMAWFRQLSVDTKRIGSIFPYFQLLGSYCNFAYSALAFFRMGMSGSASFQRVRNA